MIRDRFDGFLAFLACYFLFAALAAPVVAVCSATTEARPSEAVEFLHAPKDRPVLESVQQVFEARSTGVCTFKFGGTLYVVENMPKHYVDYSSWYVRMP